MYKSTKRLSPPVIPDTTLERFEVNSAITDALKKEAAFIHAPAGFGKTVAMSMWLARKQCPAAWIPLTVYDDNPAVFCRYLMSALSGFDAGMARHASAALASPGFDSAPFEYLFRVLSTITDACAGGVVVLDDFHHIHNESIRKALPLIISKLSKLIKFAFLSRQKPPAAFSGMAVKGMLGEVTENELRFKKIQIVNLYRIHGIELSPAGATEIESKTGGWALGLGARLLSAKSNNRESIYGGDSGEEYIYGYLKNELWNKWDDGTREFMLRTSILEDLPTELCDRLCECDSKQKLEELMQGSGLVLRLSAGLYRYHHILRDFVRQMAKEMRADLSRHYIAAAEYMHKAGKFPAALDYYMKSADKAALHAYLYRIVDYTSMNPSIEDIYASFTKLMLRRIPVETIENDLLLTTMCACVSYAGGNLEQFKLWLSKMEKCIENEADASPRLLCGALLVQFANPLIPTREIEIKNIFGNFELESIPALTITANLPYLHRSHRDYSDIANGWESVVPALIERFKAITGGIIETYMDGVVGGLLYEQNKLAKARACILRAYGRLTDKAHPEMRFALQMQLASLCLAEGDKKSAWGVISGAQEMLEKCGALYLMKNLNAVASKFRLYEGSRKAASDWLSSYIVSDTDQVAMFQIYQVFTTIRAKIMLGEFASASVLLSGAERIADDFLRLLDKLEIMILRSILFWKEKKRADAMGMMEKAVLLAQPYGYIRMFASEGAAILPILQKLYNKVSVMPENEELSKFLRELIFCASENAGIYPGLAGSPDETPVKLSARQALMLSLLSSGMNNRQICAETGLKLNTVKAHLYKLYEKLEVKSATEAVLKAYRLKLLERKE